MASNLVLLCVFLWAFNCMINGQYHEDCKDHKEQSPINIDTEETEEEDVCVIPFNWNVDYNHEGFRVENNGHTVEVTPVESEERIEESVVIATFKNIFEEEDHHKEYHLAQYHFHWGSQSGWGSEHTIDEKHFPLEVHFVHFASDSGSVKGALDNHEKCVNNHEDCDSDDHSLGVISILFDIKDEDNPAFDAILSDSIVSKIQDYTEDKPYPHDYVENAKLKDLINNVDQGGYYSYQGSLTTPPCFEIVRWFVMKKRSYVSEKQMDRFRKIKRNPKYFTDSGHTAEGNFRPIQKYLGDDNVINCGEHGSENENGNENGNENENGGNENGNEGNEANEPMIAYSAQDNYNSANNNVMSLSVSTLANLWGIGIFMFIAISLVHILLFCYWKRHTQSKLSSNASNSGAKYITTDDIDRVDTI